MNICVRRSSRALALSAAVLALFSVPAFAQLPELSGEQRARIMAAIDSGNAAEVGRIALNVQVIDPAMAAQIALFAVQKANDVAENSPDLAGEIAKLALQVVSRGSVQNIAPAVAAQVAAISVKIAATPAFIANNPALASSIAAGAAQTMAVRVVADSSPELAAQVAVNATAIVSNPSIATVYYDNASKVNSAVATLMRFDSVIAVAPGLAQQIQTATTAIELNAFESLDVSTVSRAS